MAGPAHEKGRVLLDEAGVLACRGETAVRAHGGLHAVIVFDGRVGQRAGPSDVGEAGAFRIGGADSEVLVVESDDEFRSASAAWLS